MKLKFMLIGLALALMLCISPVAAVSGSDFDIDFDNFNDDGHDTYKYYNKYTPSEKYIHIHTDSTTWVSSLVTFKPANIPSAPLMVVDTSYYEKDIYLTNTVDEWEIKVYTSFSKRLKEPDDKYLDNAGVVSMKETFGPWRWGFGSLRLDLGSKPSIWGYCFYPTTYDFVHHIWYIPEV